MRTATSMPSSASDTTRSSSSNRASSAGCCSRNARTSGRHVQLAEQHGRGDRQLPGQRGARVGRRLQRVQLGEHAPAALEVALPFARHGDGTGRAVEQPHAEPRLERGDGAGDGLGRTPQRAGGLHEAAPAGHGHEHPPFFDPVHYSPWWNSVPLSDQLFRSARGRHVEARKEIVMRFNTVTVEGLDIFYREAGDAQAPKLVLLHGYPGVVAPVPQPDPGAGRALPRHRARLSRLRKLAPCPTRASSPTRSTGSPRSPRRSWPRSGFTRFGLFVQDYGGPVGFRIVEPAARVARLADRPEQQRLRGRLHRRLGRPAPRLLEAAHAGGREAAGGLHGAGDHQADLPARPPAARADQSRQLEHGRRAAGAPEPAAHPAGPLLRLPHQRRALRRSGRTSSASASRRR